MPLLRLPRIRLARKISLLFGAAMLAVLSVTLLFPWLQMSALNEQSMLAQARQIASAAYLTIYFSSWDWGEAQARLDRVWPDIVEQLDLRIPHRVLLVPVSSPGPGFQSEAIAHLQEDPSLAYYWRRQEDSKVFRFAMAIRGRFVDRYPDKLAGIVDVSFAVPPVQGIWNTVATILAGASGALLAILTFYVVTERIVLGPVTSLKDVAERVAKGDLKVRSQISTGDEFQQLSEAVNKMLTHLREANRSLDIRVGELAQSNLALHESNRLKSEFLANVSHELRTPLVSIIGFAELLRDSLRSGSYDQARMQRFAENILTSGRSLLEIINDLLDITKIEAGKLELHLSDFSIAELCGDMIDFVRPLADKRQQALHWDIAEELPPFHSDSGKIKQILYNLLSNAIKFTPSGGEISLRVEPNNDREVRIIVRDTGPGIPPESREAIFEKFHQLDGSTTKEHEGTGLGLAITKELTQILGGRIELESEVGRGSSFQVYLPTQPPRA